MTTDKDGHAEASEHRAQKGEPLLRPTRCDNEDMARKQNGVRQTGSSRTPHGERPERLSY